MAPTGSPCSSWWTSWGSPAGSTSAATWRPARRSGATWARRGSPSSPRSGRGSASSRWRRWRPGCRWSTANPPRAPCPSWCATASRGSAPRPRPPPWPRPSTGSSPTRRNGAACAGMPWSGRPGMTGTRWRGGSRRRARGLRRALPRQHHGDRLQQDLEVEHRRPGVDVLEVELHPAIEVDVVPPADLPEAGEAGLHGQAPALPALVLGHLLGNRRPGAHQAHVPPQHVPELRQLVEAEAAKEPADRRHPRIALQLEDRAVHLVEVHQLAAAVLGVRHHGAELVEGEGAAVQPTAGLPEEDLAPLGELDRQRDHPRDRQPEEEEEPGERHVERPLGHELELAGGRGGEGEERHAVQVLQLHARPGVREEVHGEAGADPLLLQAQEEVFQPVQLLPVDGEDDVVYHVALDDARDVLDLAEDRVTVGPGLLPGVPVADEAEDAVPPETVAVDRVRDPQRRVVGAHDQHRPVVEAVRADVARGHPQAQLLGEQEEAREGREEERPEAADPVGPQQTLVPPAQVEDQGEEDRAAHADAEDRPRLVEEGDRAMRTVAPRAEQQPAPDRQGQRQQRQVVGQRVEAAREDRRRHPGQHDVPQPIGTEEGGGDKKEIETEDRDRENTSPFFEHGFYREITDRLITRYLFYTCLRSSGRFRLCLPSIAPGRPSCQPPEQTGVLVRHPLAGEEAGRPLARRFPQGPRLLGMAPHPVHPFGQGPGLFGPEPDPYVARHLAVLRRVVH